MKSFILICLLGLYSVSTPTNSQQAGSLLNQMHQQLGSISEHSYRLQLKERKLDQTYHHGQMLIRVKNQPLKIWAEVLAPNKGSLVEYDASEDLTEATVIPKKWLPAVKLKSDIHGDILRKGHYAISETSLSYFDDIIQQTEAYFEENGVYENSVRYQGETQIQHYTCHKIELIDHQYHITNYEVHGGENVLDISRKLLIHPFKIRELNTEIDSYYEVATGQELKVPSSYGKKCVVYVDTEEFLPRRLEVYDENGMFEQYTFFDMLVKR